jgi:hypothetical protein
MWWIEHVIGWVAGYMAVMSAVKEARDYLWNRPVTLSQGDWWVLLRMLYVALMLTVWQRLVFGGAA